MEQSVSPLHDLPVPARYRGTLEKELWFLRGVRDAVNQPQDSALGSGPRACVQRHQSYAAFSAYCGGLHLGRLCMSDQYRR